MITHEAAAEAARAWQLLDLSLPMSLPYGEHYVGVIVGGQQGTPERILEQTALWPITTTLDPDPSKELTDDEVRAQAYSHTLGHVESDGLLFGRLGQAVLSAGVDNAAGTGMTHGEDSRIRDIMQEMIRGAFVRGATTVSTAARVPLHSTNTTPRSLILGIWDNGQPRDIGALVATARADCNTGNSNRTWRSESDLSDAGVEASIVSRNTLVALGGMLLFACGNRVDWVAAPTSNSEVIRLTHSTTYRNISVNGNVAAVIVPFGTQRLR